MDSYGDCAWCYLFMNGHFGFGPKIAIDNFEF